MIEFLLYAASFLAGAAMAMLFLFLLWRSVNGATAGQSGVALFIKMFVRLLLISTLFFLVFRYLGIWHLISALAGFILTRSVVIRYRFTTGITGKDDTNRMEKAQ